MTLNEVLKNTNYELSLFSEEGRDFVEGLFLLKLSEERKCLLSHARNATRRSS